MYLLPHSLVETWLFFTPRRTGLCTAFLDLAVCSLFGYLPPRPPWDKVGRIGEAINPGPPFQITTLNVVSIGKYQDLLVESHPVPTVSVYTETCLTKTIFETISRKVKRAGRHLIISGICDPRKGRTRQASVVRGESGGTLVASDLPARPSRHPLPPCCLPGSVKQ